MAIDQQLSDLPTLANLPAANGNIYLRNDNEANVADKDVSFDLAAKIKSMDDAIDAVGGGGAWEILLENTITTGTTTFSLTGLTSGNYDFYKIIGWGMPADKLRVGLCGNAYNSYDGYVNAAQLRSTPYSGTSFTNNTSASAIEFPVNSELLNYVEVNFMLRDDTATNEIIAWRGFGSGSIDQYTFSGAVKDAQFNNGITSIDLTIVKTSFTTMPYHFKILGLKA